MREGGASVERFSEGFRRRGFTQFRNEMMGSGDPEAYLMR